MDDKYFMSLAIEEAKKAIEGDGYSVGAVIVKGGRVLSIEHSDETKNNGHAEELAIKSASGSISGATIYTTIEPCTMRHSGKTSCTDLIVSSGIRRVVYGVRDPHPRIKCYGVELLTGAGIEVVHLLDLEERCKQITPSIF